MIRDEELEDIDLLTEDIPVEAGGDGQLYEHFRMEVDKGQVPLIPVVTGFRKQQKLVLFR